MSQYRIQNQIAVYKTNKKLVEFNDKLKAAPVEYYGHIHAQGEKMEKRTKPIRKPANLKNTWHGRIGGVYGD